MYAVSPRSTTIKEGPDMLLFLVNTMDRLRLAPATFFRLAHIHVFQKDVDLTRDLADYEAHRFIPKYVQRYLTYIKEQES